MKTDEIYDLEHTLAKEYLSSFTYGFEALSGLSSFIFEIQNSLTDEYTEINNSVWIHKSAKVSPTAFINGPCVIGKGSEIRHSAFIRGSVLIGENCVIGNSTEIKNSILFDGVQVPHFNYAGDSILGYKSHMGAGSLTSNVKSDQTLVTVKNGEERIETGLKKFGAMLGDHVEVGCNSVLNPGTVVGRHSNVYPTSCVRGVVPENSIWKNDGRIVKKERR